MKKILEKKKLKILKIFNLAIKNHQENNLKVAKKS